MSGSLSPTAVIVIVIVTAGGTVLIGYAIYAAFNRGNVNPFETVMQKNDEQERYMRELREKHYASIRAEAGWPRRPMPSYKNQTQTHSREVSSPEY